MGGLFRPSPVSLAYVAAVGVLAAVVNVVLLRLLAVRRTASPGAAGQSGS